MKHSLYTTGPFSFYKNKRVTKLWFGDQIFLAERSLQEECMEGDYEGDLPIPDWDQWLAHGKAVSYALYEATDMFFTLWLESDPYRFAINATSRYGVPDVYVKTEVDLYNWQTQKGVEPEDVTFGRHILHQITDLLPIGLNFRNYTGWCRWGGVYVQDPNFTE